MSAQLKEALAALEGIELGGDELMRVGNNLKMAVIRNALKLAAHESEAWEAIEASHVKLGVTYSIGSWRVDSSKKLITLMQAGKEVFRFLGLDRLEAIEAAATWCRAEMAK